MENNEQKAERLLRNDLPDGIEQHEASFFHPEWGDVASFDHVIEYHEPPYDARQKLHARKHFLSWWQQFDGLDQLKTGARAMIIRKAAWGLPTELLKRLSAYLLPG